MTLAFGGPRSYGDKIKRKREREKDKEMIYELNFRHCYIYYVLYYISSIILIFLFVKLSVSKNREPAADPQSDEFYTRLKYSSSRKMFAFFSIRRESAH